MFDVNINTKGFAELLSETYRDPSPEEVLRRIGEIDVKMTHNLLGRALIKYDESIGMWIVDTPSGWLGLTATAHQQLSARMRSAGPKGVVGFSMTETTNGPVALGTGSDKYGYIPFDEQAKRVQRLLDIHDADHKATEMVISPSFVRVLYKVEEHKIAGDVVTLGWGWQSAHDGSSSLRVFDRVEREICSNGLRATVNDEILRLRHVWGGMQSHQRRALARDLPAILPASTAAYLARHSTRKMELKLDESILAAIDRQLDSGRFTIQRAKDLSEKRYWEETHAWDMTKKILELTMDESKAGMLKDILGLKQESFKFLKQYRRESLLLQTVKDNLRKYGASHNYSAWSIVQSLNDRPTLGGRFPVSGMDAMESLSNAVLTNWEQLVLAVA